MSNILNRVLNNLATRIMFIIYVFFILVTCFFIIFGYFNELNLQKQRQYDKLKGIVTSAAINIDGDLHSDLISKYSKSSPKDDIRSDPIYRLINQKLNQIVIENELNSPLYTLSYNKQNEAFYYGIRSDRFIDFKNDYVQSPTVLMDNMDTGGIIPAYESENGIWISAFHPIKSSKGDVVAILEADIEFSEFKSIVNNQYLKEALIMIFVIILFFIFFVMYTRKILISEAKQKRILSLQKRMIEIKNKDIMDSIYYALKIQTAMLPSTDQFKTNFKDSFVFYKSKDVVAGDFYWMEKIGDDIFLAVADCTGHGVPGAILSIICANALDKVICEMKLKNTGKILDTVRDNVITFLSNGDYEMNDGMDIALCKINLESLKLEYSGAYNPVYIISENGNLVTTDATKQPVGRFITHDNFKVSNHTLHKKDRVYLFTDGYPDQFGGAKNKKFMHKNFRNLLIENFQKPMSEQEISIEQTLENWKGDAEQVDDICVVGITI